MEHCGDTITEKQKIQKTLSTFNPQNYAISTELEMKGYENFDTLVSVLLRQEKHLNLIQKNYDVRLKSNEANGTDNKGKEPESHYTSSQTNKRKRSDKRPLKKFNKRNKKPQRNKRNIPYRTNSSNTCNACGMKGHWAKSCRTSQFHQNLYQQSKTKLKKRNNSKPNESENFMSKGPMTLSDSGHSDFESHCIEILFNQGEEVDKTISYKECLIDSATTHCILKSKALFTNLKMLDHAPPIRTLGGKTKLIKGEGTASISFPNGTTIRIKRAFYAPTASRNLIGFRDFRANNFHLNTATCGGGVEILDVRDNNRLKLEEFPTTGNGLYKTSLSKTPSKDYDVKVSSYASSMKQSDLIKWHDRLGHPGKNIFRKVVLSTRGTTIPRDCTQHHDTCPPCMMGQIDPNGQAPEGLELPPGGSFDPRPDGTSR